eukprot:4243836-Pyramimonas_sp.AAC.1
MALRRDIPKHYTDGGGCLQKRVPRTLVLKVCKSDKNGGGRFQYGALALATRTYVVETCNGYQDSGRHLFKMERSSQREKLPGRR